MIRVEPGLVDGAVRKLFAATLDEGLFDLYGNGKRPYRGIRGKRLNQFGLHYREISTLIDLEFLRIIGDHGFHLTELSEFLLDRMSGEVER